MFFDNVQFALLSVYTCFIAANDRLDKQAEVPSADDTKSDSASAQLQGQGQQNLQQLRSQGTNHFINITVSFFLRVKGIVQYKIGYVISGNSTPPGSRIASQPGAAEDEIGERNNKDETNKEQQLTSGTFFSFYLLTLLSSLLNLILIISSFVNVL